MNYAVIETGGMQFRVQPGERIRVPSIKAEVGSTIEFKPLVLKHEGGIVIGQPRVETASVTCRVVEHGRGRKLVVFKFRRRKQYRLKKGHRQGYTTLHIQQITHA
ncbi:MAG: 50S ribosomal protein L21 [Acidobacteriota bacterium]|nr:50S ribosomal protein L21 [Blastocatellia bacterium]MDW8240293.1 50S ribosomal protein L21 [Acidobacteriota bacterium]